MSQQGNKNTPLLCNDNPWNSNSNDIWFGSTLTLNRNLEKFNFPEKLSLEKGKQIVPLLSQIILSNDQLKKPQLIQSENMASLEKEFLVEHFLSDQGFQQAHGGEAFILDLTGEFLAVINFKDHLQLHWIDPREDLENVLEKLIKIELEINKSLNFAFSPKFGFLTSDSSRCGTALSVNIFLHLPVLIYLNRLNDIFVKNKDDGIGWTGLQGDPHEIIGDIVAIHNSYTLGVTEENIITSLRTLATKLVAEEKSLRQQLKNENEVNLSLLKDKVSRAYGILLHSYQIEAVEALQSLSLLKMGFDLGWVKGTSQMIMNQLFFACRRAHLICHFDEKISQEALPHKRAEFIHKALHGLELLI